MMTNNFSFSTRRLAWQSKMGAGTCLALLIALNAPGKQALEAPVPQHAIPARRKEVTLQLLSGLCLGCSASFIQKGARPPRGLLCSRTMTATPGFHAVWATAGNKVQPLTLDCKDSAGRPSNFAVDLTFG
jgi:hypothetical protein